MHNEYLCSWPRIDLNTIFNFRSAFIFVFFRNLSNVQKKLLCMPIFAPRFASEEFEISSTACLCTEKTSCNFVSPNSYLCRFALEQPLQCGMNRFFLFIRLSLCECIFSYTVTHVHLFRSYSIQAYYTYQTIHKIELNSSALVLLFFK